jgi:hypothetical protein
MGACVFCGKPGKLTKEHSVPAWTEDWLRQALGAKPDEPIHHQWSPPADSPHEGYSYWSPRVSFTTRSVCASCNNGWMAQLETDVRPFLGPMIRGDQTTLGEAERRLLAFWAVKTVLMNELIRPMDNQLLPVDAACRQLYQDRQPAYGSRVGLGYVDLDVRQGNWQEAAPVWILPRPQVGAPDAYLSGQAVGHVLLSVQLPNPDTLQTRRIVDAPANPGLSQLWPERQGDLRGPEGRGVKYTHLSLPLLGRLY